MIISVSAYFNEVVTRTQSQNVSRVISSFRCTLKYHLHVPGITLALTLAPAVTAYLAAEMSGSSDQSSIQLLIRTSNKI